MKVLRCECGAKAIWLEGASFDCLGCEICRTPFALKGEQRQFQSHKWAIVFDDEQGLIYTRCTICGIDNRLNI